MDLSGGGRGCTILGQLFDAVFGGVSSPATAAVLLFHLFLTARVDRPVLLLSLVRPIAQSSEYILRLSLLEKRLLFPERRDKMIAIVRTTFLFPASAKELT